MKYEYKVIDCLKSGVPLGGSSDSYPKMLEDGLNGYGQEGWCLCHVAGGLMIFCREIPVDSGRFDDAILMPAGDKVYEVSSDGYFREVQ